VGPQGATPELGGRPKLWPSSSSVPSRALHQGRSPQKGVRRALDLRHRCQECQTPLLRTSQTIQGALSIGAFVATRVYTYTSKSAKDEDAALFDWDEDNVSHVRGNGIEPHEAEEAVLDPGRVSAPLQH
jgi:hypothetical protein